MGSLGNRLGDRHHRQDVQQLWKKRRGKAEGVCRGEAELQCTLSKGRTHPTGSCAAGTDGQSCQVEVGQPVLYAPHPDRSLGVVYLGKE